MHLVFLYIVILFLLELMIFLRIHDLSIKMLSLIRSIVHSIHVFVLIPHSVICDLKTNLSPPVSCIIRDLPVCL